MVAERVWDPPPPAREDDVEPPTEPSGLLALVLRMLPYALIAILPGLLLAPWFGIPFDQDEGAYVTVARGMNHGLVPYRDLFDHKPPLIYGMYWIIDAFAGGAVEFRVVAAVFAGLTALLVVATARRLGLERSHALAGGVLYALSVSNIALQSNANTEVFMSLPLLGALYATLRSQERSSARWFAAAGVMLAVAMLFKTPAVFTAAPLVVYVALRCRNRAAMIVWFCIGFTAVVGACAILFASAGAFGDFWYANVTYNELYSQSTPLASRLELAWQFRRDVLLGGLPFWIIGCAGAAVALAKRDLRSSLLLAWTAFSFASIKFTGRDSAHYYVQLLPSAALLGAVALASFPKHVAARVTVAAVLTPLFAIQAGVYAGMVVPGNAHAEYAGISDCEAAGPALGSWINEHTSPGSVIYNLGRDTEIYYYADRMPAARFMYDRPFYLDRSTADETALALRNTRPSLIVDTMDVCTPPSLAVPADISALIASDYSLVETIGHARIYAPKPPG